MSVAIQICRSSPQASPPRRRNLDLYHHVLGLYDSYDLSHIPPNSERIELLLLLVPWVNNFSRPRRRQSLQLLVPFFQQTRRPQQLLGTGRMILRLILLWLFHIYLIYLVQIWCHEYLGHLLMGGGLLSYPITRYQVSYPSPYYTIRLYDTLANFTQHPNWSVLSNFLYFDRFQGKPAGHAYPWLRTPETNFAYSPVYYLWGYEQSQAWVYLSGSIPVILFTLVGIYLVGRPLGSYDYPWRRYTVILLLYGYIWVLSYALGALGVETEPTSRLSNHDYFRWSYHYAKHLGVSTSWVAWSTALTLLGGILGVIRYTSYDFGTQHWAPVSRHTLLLTMMRDASTQSDIADVALQLWEQAVPIKVWKSVQHQLMDRSESDVFQMWDEMAPVVSCLRRGLNFDILAKYYQLKSPELVRQLQYPKSKRYRNRVSLVFVVWIATPLTELLCYRNGVDQRWISIFRWLGVTWGGLILLQCYTDLQMIHTQWNRYEVGELGGKLVAFIGCVLASVGYDIRQVSNLWYGPWLAIVFLAQYLASWVRYQRMKVTVQQILAISPPL